MNRNVKIAGAVALVVLLAVAAAVVLTRGGGGEDDGETASGTSGTEATTTTAAPVESGEPQLVREGSHRVATAAEGDATLVAFLDFESRTCKDVFALIAQLQTDYEDRATIVIRSFPDAALVNSERAARAAEAAGEQGQYDAMASALFASQSAWGGQQAPLDQVFRGIAEQLELDLDAFDTAYEAPATAARVAQDVADGQAFNVQFAPAFFLDGEMIQPRNYEEMSQAVAAAIGD